MEARDDHDSPFAKLIGRSRMIVIVAVIAVLLAAFSLFLLGAVFAAETVYRSWVGVIEGELGSTELTIHFLEIVTMMLKAVVFYLIGVGLYSLFIAPLNLTIALGVETLNDLETKIISVVIVILAVTFLQRFIAGHPAVDLLQTAGALSLMIAALVFFKIYAHREGQSHKHQHPNIQARAKHEMFEQAHEEHEVKPDEVHVHMPPERPPGN